MFELDKKIHLNEGGWYWPIDDINQSCWKGTLKHKETPQKLFKYIKNKEVCVTAGANCGFFVKQYAYLFDFVYAFEPEPINFYCLNLNIKESNVFKIQSFLGNEHKLYDIEYSQDIGGHNIGKYPKPGSIPMLKIDDLNLSSCSMIQADVEGYEINLLKGGVETIRKYFPLIVVEIAWSDATEYLNSIGYEKIEKIDNDWIFLPK